MRRHAASQRTEVVAAFEQRNDAAPGVACGHAHHLLGDPGVIRLDQAELRVRQIIDPNDLDGAPRFDPDTP